MHKIQEPLLEIKNLNASFGRFSLKNINLEIYKNQKLAIVGESGSGKSLLSQLILGLQIPKSINGEILFEKSSLLDYKNCAKIRGVKIAYIPQSPLSALNPLHSIQTQILEMFKLHRKSLPTSEQGKLLDEALSLVGLPLEIKNRLPHTLSGGQRQRVLIAMMSILKPDILICDEPTTALDANIQRQILDLLASFKNTAILLISHDLASVRYFADSVAVMKNGEIVESGKVEHIFSTPKHPYTKFLIQSLKLPQISTTPRNEVMLEFKNFGVFYLKRKLFKNLHISALEDINFKLKANQSLGIIGESGSGKSSFALGVLGLERTNGEMIFENTALDSMKRDEYFRDSVQIVFQDPLLALNPRFCVYEIIAEALDSKMSDEQSVAYVNELLQKVRLDSSFLYRYPESLSGGECQRIAIARALAKHPKILILDEPTSALDKTTQKATLELLLEIQAILHLSYIFISHDLDVIEAMCDEVVVLKDGHVIEQGLTREIFTFPKHNYTKALLDSRL